MQINVSDTIRALLVTLECSAWRGQRVVHEVAEEVARQHRSERGSTTVTKHLVPTKYLKPILQAQMSARYTFDQQTLPWDDSGTRLLPARSVMTFRNAMQDVTKVHEAVVKDFVGFYPTILEQSKGWLGDLYKPEDYPNPAELPHMFRLRVLAMPLPDPAAFSRLGHWVADDVLTEAADQATQLINDRLMQAQQALYRRVLERIDKLVVGLTARERFSGDLLVRLQNIIEVAVDEFSIVDDPKLVSICNTLQAKLAFVSAPMLRTDQIALTTTLDALRQAKAALEAAL